MSDKSRKILWGRSGNRCAVCRAELVVEATELDSASVVGDECHIVSGQENGPRCDATTDLERIDHLDNLILLCRVHHKMVDDQEETYTATLLRQVKLNHEKWVTSVLTEVPQQAPVRIRPIRGNVPTHLMRVLTGADLLNLSHDTFAASHDHDEPTSNEEAELLSGFFQEVEDWGDIIDEMEAGDRVRAGFRMTAAIKELAQAGFWVFGAREVRRLEGGIGPPSAWPVLHLCVLRKDNPRIIHLPGDAAGGTVESRG